MQWNRYLHGLKLTVRHVEIRRPRHLWDSLSAGSRSLLEIHHDMEIPAPARFCLTLRAFRASVMGAMAGRRLSQYNPRAVTCGFGTAGP
jgi:hypothetical protein